MRISALVHSRNEAAWIGDCLRSLQWADEIVLADMASTDATREIATSLRARIVEVPLADNVDKVRNQAIASCTGDWILVVDADERVSPGLATRVAQLAAHPTADAYWVPRRNYFLGEWVEHLFWPDAQIRLFRRGAAAWDGIVHHHPAVTGKLEALPADPHTALEHPGFGSDINRFVTKILRYSPLEVERLRQLGVDPIQNLLRRPLAEFAGRYFGGGYRHGGRGLALSLLLGVYQLLAGMYYWEATLASRSEVPPAKLRRRVVAESWRFALKLLLRRH